MRLTLSLCFAISFQLLVAQQYNIKAINNPGIPLVFEHPDQKRAFVLFTPEKTVIQDQTLCFLFEASLPSWDNLRKTTFALRTPGGEDRDIRLFGRVARADCGYFVVENNGMLLVHRIHWDDLSLIRTDSFLTLERERVKTAVSKGENLYLLSYFKDRKKGDHIFIYSLNKEGKLVKHDFPIDAVKSKISWGRDEKNLEELIDKYDFSPIPVEEGLEFPAQTKAHSLVFAGENSVYWTVDVVKGKDNPGGYLSLVRFDLKQDSFYHKSYDYGDPKYGRSMKGGSYIFDGKIFQVASNEFRLQISVRDLFTGNLLYNTCYEDKDTIRFANSPILMPGRFLLESEKNMVEGKKFLKRLKKCVVSVQVRREGNDYLLCIGGSEEVTRAATRPGPMNPRFPSSNTYFTTKQNDPFSFYSALNGINYFRSETRYPRTIASLYEFLDQPLDQFTDESIFLIGGKYYRGRYDKKSDFYSFKDIK